MNYIRGAISTISAPYQYYKELPPINPSTLTGAIDVIVVQRAGKGGETELACSPFHVRFGKWQVLRPSEKTVTVTVNGKPIPFNMKIGEAGEAFFVFETDDDDVPADLITSPILQPTRPEDDPDVPDVPTDRFGAKPDSDGEEQEEQKQEEQTKTETQEPDFLDLNDSGQSRPEGNTAAQSLPSPPPSPSLNPTQVYDDPDAKVDAMLKTLQKDLHLHDVEYRHGVALDAEGYHTHEHHHNREASEQTITDHDSDLLIPHSQSQFIASSSKAIPFPRATSEPPPDFEEDVTPPPVSTSSKPNQLSISPPLQAYSWEWGAFPQPSPMKTTFSKSGRLEAHSKGKRKATTADSMLTVEDRPNRESGDHHRSRSVPPVIDGVPTLRGDEDSSDDEDLRDHQAAAGYGAGGRLAPSKSDPKRFAVVVEGRKMRFDLSIVSDAGVFRTPDELEAARTFEEGRIEYSRFLEDGQLVDDPKLVIRWAGDHYITQDDGSPLKDALSLWRQAALQESASRFPPRPISPVSDEEEDEEDSPPDFSEQTPPLTTSPERKHHDRAKSEPPETGLAPPISRKPTSSSWVRWWSLSRTVTNDPTPTGPQGGRPEIRESSSAPPEPEVQPSSVSVEKSSKKILPAESAPALPSTPVQDPPTDPFLKTLTPKNLALADSAITSSQSVKKRRKFVKTLRLTSDQLKSLELKPGPNSITFSLSSTGVVACTARIFVWDYTDLIVVSDIDGTITKSDGLGHVFAMIGRDWTHLGVAKLYTDICRNGYKIMYLTSRAIGQADATRGYLKGIKQNDYQLPEGPVIMSPDRLMASLHREVIMRKPEVFKMACLRDIRQLFGDNAKNSFYAGFGNRITDALSYRSVNVPSSRIFTIDSSGEVKLELLELAGYKSSYIHMTDLVDQMFPPIHRKWAAEYTDFNYWKVPIQQFSLPDLSPPSPALSARSDTSNQSTLARIRNFSLVGSRQPTLVPTRENAGGEEEGNLSRRSSRLIQMSSFERLSNTLSNFTQASSGSDKRRSMSPMSHSSSSNTYADSDDEYDEDAEDPAHRRRRDRRRSMTSMPGSLDDEQFGFDEEDEEDEGEGSEEYDSEGMTQEDQEAAAERALDEDVMKVAEMDDIPYL
ncbi:lipin Ned1 [Pleurotus ostreatus]|nr:lipin Ned1 [Pleurotus ostreatus]